MKQIYAGGGIPPMKIYMGVPFFQIEFQKSFLRPEVVFNFERIFPNRFWKWIYESGYFKSPPGTIIFLNFVPLHEKKLKSLTLGY